MQQIQIDLVPLLIAVIGSGGIGAAGAKLVDGLLKIRAGMSARENQRRADIAQQRDAALSRESRAWSLVDAEAAKRRREQEYSARLRRQLIENGIEPGHAPARAPSPTSTQLAELRRTEGAEP